MSSNPTTGYDWIFNTESCDGTLKTIQSYEVDAEADMMAGVGGKTTFTLVGLKSGECLFELVYVRSWEFTGFENVALNDPDYI